MLNNLPLHALVVHLPIALTVLVPLFAIGALILGRRGVSAHKVWAVPVALMAMLLVSGLVAENTGEDQEDRVEQVVPKQAMHDHEEAAELFVLVAGGALLVAAGGLLPNRAGAMLRVAGTVGTLVVFATGWNVGHSGGALVYQHNAGSAYAQNAGTGPGANAGMNAANDDH